MRKLTRKTSGSSLTTLVDPFRRRTIQSESDLETKHGICLIARPDIVEIREQQRVEYRKNGRRRHHYIDFLVIYDDGKRVAYSVKYVENVESTDLRGLLRDICEGCDGDFADEYVILTEGDIDLLTLRNATEIIACGKDFDIEAMTAVRDALPSCGQTVTPREIGRFTGLGRRGERATIALIQSGAVTLRRGDKVSPDTPFDNPSSRMRA